MKVTDLRVYPVKSLGGEAVDSVAVEPWGLAGDRRFALLDSDGAKVTAREVPRTLLLTATRTDDALVLRDLDGVEHRVATPTDGEVVATGIKRQPTARRCDEATDAWLSARLGRPVRLVWQEDPTVRSVTDQHGGQPGDVVSLADAGPLLLVSRSSLRRLNEWVEQTCAERGEGFEPLSQLRFRHNVEIDGAEPFAEDAWAGVRIGEVEFRAAMVCDRCVMTTVDPRTGAKGKEPVRTLARHRRWDGATWYGVRLVPQGTGQVRVGDDVTPLD